MCVICVQPSGKYLDRETAKAMWDKNPDGGGFAYIKDNGEIVVRKFMTWNSFWGSFEHHRSENRNANFLIHMRIATHGAVNVDNVHPFVVDEHTVMMHNGIIHEVEADPTNQMSDTRIFIRDVLSELPGTWLDKPYLGKMVSNFIGWSKLAFLTTNPELESTVYIVNEKSGTWDNDLWFSNMNHKAKTGGKSASSYIDCKTVYSPATNYKGGTQNDQTWDYDTKEWSDGPYTNHKNLVFKDEADQELAESKLVLIPSEDQVKEYESLADYWADKDEQDIIEAAYQEVTNDLYLDKGGRTWNIAESPWSNTIDPQTKKNMMPIWEQLRDIRETCYFPKPICYDDEYGYWWCYGCDEDVAIGSGVCQCWDKYCLDCGIVAAECTCPTGYSNNLTNSANVFEQNTKEKDETATPL